MKITFIQADTFRNCPSIKTCGIGKIRHHIGQYEEDGKIKKAYQCCRCRTVTVEDKPER